MGHSSGRAVFLACALTAALNGASAFGAGAADAVAAAVKKSLESRFTDGEIIDVRPSPIPGLYEVFTGQAIVYSDAAGDTLLIGNLIDTRTRRNMTAERLDERNAIDFQSLPFDLAIKVVKGDGRRKLAVFTDPDCPFCQRFERDLGSLTDVTIYNFLYPIPSLHPAAVARARAIWCAADRSEAWAQWMLEKRDPAARECTDDPVDALQGLGEKLRVSGTPTLFLADGRRVGGAVPAAQLDELLETQPVKPTAANP